MTVPGWRGAYCELCANGHGMNVAWPCPTHLALHGETEETCTHGEEARR